MGLTFGLARRLPGSLVVGVELRRECAALAREEKRRRGISNVHFVQGRAEDVAVRPAGDLYAIVLPGQVCGPGGPGGQRGGDAAPGGRSARWAAGVLIALLVGSGPAAADTGTGAGGVTPRLLVERLEAARADVRDYRALLVTTAREHEGPPQRTTARYWFQKPNRLRLEFVSPHPGLVLVYPYRPQGHYGEVKARVQPGGSSSSSG